MKKIRSVFAVVLTVITALCLFAFTSSAADEGKWIKTWSTAATEIGIEGYDFISAAVQDLATRTVITPTASGTKIRVKFSNAYGKKDLVIDRATAAISTGASGIDAATMKVLTFNSGSFGVTIPAGEEVYSDAVSMNVKADQNIAVSTYIRDFMEVRTMGLTGGETYIKAGGGIGMVEAVNFNPLTDLEFEEQWVYNMLDKLLGTIIGQGTLEIPTSYSYIQVVPVITEVEVLNPNEDAFSVVVIGDTTVANKVPEYLAQEIHAMNISDIGVAGKGIIGNCLIGEGLGYGSLVYGEPVIQRMKKDIIGVDGKNEGNVKYVVLKAGAFDLIYPVSEGVTGVKQPTANDLIEGYKKVFDFCHKNGIKVVVIGITPWGGYSGTTFSSGIKYDRRGDNLLNDWKIAEEVNKWLSKSALHDGFVDYYELSNNPKDPTALLPEYTTDGLQPSDKLQRLWADSFPISLVGATDRVAGLSLSSGEVSVFKGKTQTLTAKIVPENATNRALKWTSSNEKVATVDSNGKVTGVSKGTAVITVSTVDKGYSGTGYSASCKVTVKIKPESLVITGKENILYTTKSTTLTATVSPSNADDKTVKWSSDKEKVATVNSKGVVTATGKGTAIITAVSTADSSVKATYKIKVNKKKQVQAVYLNYDERSRYVGTSFTLVPSVSPSDATFPEVTWTSSDKKIAKVDKNGKVTAVKAGVAVITCKSVDNPKVNATCIVTVKVKTKGVKLPTEELTLYVSKTKTLKAEVLPSNATSKSVKWSSSNEKVATVSKSGKITAKKPGTTVITVKTTSGGYKDTCKVTVKKYVALKSFKLEKTSISVQNGKTYTLKPVFTPSNTSEKDLVWSSSDKKIATVSSKGVVKGIKAGTATITCKSKATGKKVKCTVKVTKVKVKAILFAEKKYTVKDNKTLQLKAHISPVNATNQKIKWKSSKPEYAKVSSGGKVTGLKAGKTVTITATTVDGKKVATCKVKVEKVPVTGVKLNKTKATVYAGGKVTLTAKLSPSKPSDSKLIWTSSDEKLTKVSEKGVVTAIKKGKVTITCTTNDGGYKASCSIEITEAVKATGIKLDKTEETANIGTAFNLIATVEPENASNKKVVWSSTNPEVATVTANGRVVTLKEGFTYIKVKTEDGRYSANCKITVVP